MGCEIATRNRKVPGDNGIQVELLEAMDEYGTNTLLELYNVVSEHGEFPDDLLKSVFITIPNFKMERRSIFARRLNVWDRRSSPKVQVLLSSD